MLEFMYSYEREANPKVSEEQLHERGKKMIEVNILITLFNVVNILFNFRKQFRLYQFRICFGEFGGSSKWKSPQLDSGFRYFSN